MIELSDSLIRATVTANAYVAGLAYMRNGRVKAIGIEPTRGTIRATVQGSGGSKYKLAINVAERGGNATVAGECSCPVGYNCKHVAAVLFAQKQLGSVPVAAPPVKTQPPAQRQPPQPQGPALPPELAAWLSGLAGSEEESEAYPSAVAKRLFYMLGASVERGVPLLDVELAVGDVRNDGTINPRSTSPDAFRLIQTDPPPKYLRPSDRAILRRMSGDMIDRHKGHDEAALRDILATGRARIGAFPGRPAQLAEARGGALEWRLDERGNQTPSLQVTGGGKPFLLDRPWYLDAATGQVGPLEIPISASILRRLLGAPPISPEQAATVRKALSSHAGVPLPQEVPHGGTIGGKPTPQIRLGSLPFSHNSDFARFGQACAEISFRYGHVSVPAHAPYSAAERIIDGKRYTLKRSQSAEKQVLLALQKFGFSPVGALLRWGVPAGSEITWCCKAAMSPRIGLVSCWIACRCCKTAAGR